VAKVRLALHPPPVRAQAQAKRRVENKKDREPMGNPGLLLQVDRPLGLSTGRENQRAERKKAKKVLRVLGLNNSNLVWDKRRSRNSSGAVLHGGCPL
jgi:hypothetical protein